MTHVLAPCPGRVLALADIPDPVFSSAMVGQGVGIDPARERTTVVSPIAGMVAKVHPHAFVVMAEDGTGVLVHLGINTNRLKGAGFEVHVEQGDELAAGAPVVTWNPAEVTDVDMSPVVPVVVMDAKDAQVLADPGADVAPGDMLFTLAR